jgi:hypothetical protein
MPGMRERDDRVPYAGAVMCWLPPRDEQKQIYVLLELLYVVCLF